MLGHKTSLSRLKKKKIVQSIFSYHCELKQETNSSKKIGKITNMQKWNNIFQQSMGWKKSQEKLENMLGQGKIKITEYKIYEMQWM